VVEVRQHVPGEQVSLRGVRVTGQDEGFHAEVCVVAELGKHLAWVAHDGRAGTGTRASDACPQVRLDVALVVRLVP